MTGRIYAVTVPKWGIEMQEGTVAGWHLREGDEVTRGDELIDVETDKIVNTMEAASTGVLKRCLANKGDTLKVGALLGVIALAEVDDRTIDEFIAGFEPADAGLGQDEGDDTGEPAGDAAMQPEPEAAPEPRGAKPGRVRVSPAAARRARELGVDISEVKSAGRRISPHDVERHARAHPRSQSQEPEGRTDYEAHPLSATRKSIAVRLVEAKQQIPHFYLSADITMDAALDRRAGTEAPGSTKVSVNDLLMRAAVLALQAVPAVNIHLVADEIRQFRQVNLAMAVATERGIITPVVHQAQDLTLVELAHKAAALRERARDASLSREDLEGGTFTVTNLGMYGITEFQAIINPPQGAILALGSCEERLVPGTEGIQTVQVMRATLSCDHRAIDGALGAQFLSELKSILENAENL